MERRGVAAAASLDLPGFRFHPTEEELLEFYLKQQVSTKKKQQAKAPFDIIPTVHLYRHDPWDLPALAAIASEREWYFFVPRDGGTRGKLQGHVGRPSRTTERGFWKATGSDRAVRCAADPKRLVGLKKTLVYYQGRAPRGAKTDWVMNEYRLPEIDGGAMGGGKAEQQEVVLCKVYRKAVSLKELEQRVAMEELARTRSSASPPTASRSHSHCSSPDVSSSSASEVVHETAAVTVAVKSEDAAVARPAAMRLPQLETARGPGGGGLEWMQDPFLTQLRSPWMESLCLSPYYPSVLNF